jgi:uncharacterized RDD family membrane protein YckC
MCGMDVGNTEIADVAAVAAPGRTTNSLWIYSEFIVLLTNEKRRALHDFMAGTIVIENPRLHSASVHL